MAIDAGTVCRKSALRGWSKSPASSLRRRSSVSSVLATESVDGLAAGAAALVHAAAQRHRRLDAGGAQPVGQLAVQLAQVDAQQAGGRRDQRLAHRGVGHVVAPASPAARARRPRAAAGSGPGWMVRQPSSVLISASSGGSTSSTASATSCCARATSMLWSSSVVLEQLQVLEAQHLGLRLFLAAALVHQAGQFGSMKVALDGLAVGLQVLDGACAPGCWKPAMRRGPAARQRRPPGR